VRKVNARANQMTNVRKETANLERWNAENWLTDREDRLFIFNMSLRTVFLTQSVGV